jgi:hypothetical protein
VVFDSKPPTIEVGNSSIKFRTHDVASKGVYEGIDVKAHCKYMSDKLMALFRKLGNMARDEWGVRNKTLSVIYGGVFLSTIVYVTATCADLCSKRAIRSLRTMRNQDG